MKKTKRYYLLSTISIIILIIFDQVTKYIAYANLRNQSDCVWIKNVFVLHYLENQSAAFSLDPITILNRIFHFQAFADNPDLFLKTKMIFFVILTVIVIILVYWVFTKIPNTKKFRILNIMMILFFSGAIGNCIDRVIHNYVIDFFYFELIDFPIFNVADIYVTVAAFAFVILLLFVYKESDLEEIFPKKKNSKEENDNEHRIV